MTTSTALQSTYSVAECIGMTVNQYMFEQRLTKTAMAQVLGVSQPGASRRITGDIDWTVGDLVLMADWLGLELEDLVPVRDEVRGWLPAPFVPGKAVPPLGLEPRTNGL